MFYPSRCCKENPMLKLNSNRQTLNCAENLYTRRYFYNRHIINFYYFIIGFHVEISFARMQKSNTEEDHQDCAGYHAAFQT